MLNFDIISKRFDNLKDDYNFTPPKMRKPNWRIVSESALSIKYFPEMQDAERTKHKFESIYLTAKGESAGVVIKKIKEKASSFKDSIIKLIKLIWERLMQFVRSINETIENVHIKNTKKHLEKCMNDIKSNPEKYTKFRETSFTLQGVNLYPPTTYKNILDGINDSLGAITTAIEGLASKLEDVDGSMIKALNLSADIIVSLNKYEMTNKESSSNITGEEVIEHLEQLLGVFESITVANSTTNVTLLGRFKELYNLIDEREKADIVDKVDKLDENDIILDNILTEVQILNQLVMQIDGATRKYIGGLMKISSKMIKLTRKK